MEWKVELDQLQGNSLFCLVMVLKALRWERSQCVFVTYSWWWYKEQNFYDEFVNIARSKLCTHDPSVQELSYSVPKLIFRTQFHCLITRIHLTQLCIVTRNSDSYVYSSTTYTEINHRNKGRIHTDLQDFTVFVGEAHFLKLCV